MDKLKHTPTPWGIGETISEGIVSYSLVTLEKSRTIMDTFNSEVAEIHEEYDEEGRCQWDEQGRANIEFARLAVNSHAALMEALKTARKYVVSRSPAALVSEVEQIDKALRDAGVTP